MIASVERDPKTLAQRFVEGGVDVASSLAVRAILNKTLRSAIFRRAERRVIQRIDERINPRWPAQVRKDQADMVRAMFASADRALERNQVSRKVLKRMLKTLLANLALGLDEQAQRAVEQFAQRHDGQPAPLFLVISPTKACNLRCIGCYADSDDKKVQLEWDVVDRIITEAKQLWGIRFITISGGEPLTYRSQGKHMVELFEKHDDCFFLMYTNGCLIDRQTAERLADAGNVTPAISVEGFEARTDERRGRGVFKRILAGMANLREAGVPFGISVTATRHNAEEILSDEFIEFFFEQQQAVFGWIFQYMPIGRGYTTGLLVTPEQRLWMWKRTWQIIRERKIMLADFWNCGTVSSGCIAAGDAYFYIDWHGKIMPCVFVPYSAANIHDIYARGGTLDDIYDLPYFKAIRRWQWDYATGKDRDGRCGNWILPCPLRDHYHAGRSLIDQYQPEPEDRSAAEALSDETYRQRMLAYDEDLKRLFDPIWEQEYLESQVAQEVK